jgi:predicted transcriptional regulator
MEQNLYFWFLKYNRMSTIELKRELHSLIDEEDDKSIVMFYQMVKSYIVQKRKDKMIAEGEEDIKNGRLHSLKEAKEIMDKWETK